MQALIDALQGHFAAMFPPQGTGAVDADHVWSFFAALASASSQGAVTITVEVKEVILQTIMNRDKDPHAVAALNTFLNVMGLNDTMVMA